MRDYATPYADADEQAPEVMSNTSTGMTLVFGARREKRAETLPRGKGNAHPAAPMPPSSCRGRCERRRKKGIVLGTAPPAQSSDFLSRQKGPAMPGGRK